jgi:hypothetical protein
MNEMVKWDKEGQNTINGQKFYEQFENMGNWDCFTK